MITFGRIARRCVSNRLHLSRCLHEQKSLQIRYETANETVKTWNTVILNSSTAHSIAHTISQELPREALQEPLVWSTIINVFKRHHVVGGLVWVVNEMKARSIPMSEEFIANLISAWGHVGLSHWATHLWETEPALRDSEGLARASLLSITAVALGRCGKRMDREVRTAKEILRQHDALDMKVVFSWGRLMHAYVLARDMDGAKETLQEYRSLLEDDSMTPINLFNVLIRGYGDVRDLPAALATFDEARSVCRRIEPGMEMDVVEACIKCFGHQAALEFLSREGNPEARPEPFIRLLRNLLDKREVSMAQQVYNLLLRRGDDEEPADVETMMSKFPRQETMKHKLWHRGHHGPEGPSKITWAEVICQSPNADVTERLLQYGMCPFRRAELENLLRHCQAVQSVTGIDMLLENRAKIQNYNVWKDAGLGLVIMKKLGKIRQNALTPETRAKAQALAKKVVERWDPPRDVLLLKLTTLYALGPEASTEYVKTFRPDGDDTQLLRELLPASKSFFKALASDELYAAVLNLYDRQMVTREYLEAFLPAIFGTGNVSTFAELMLRLVPQHIDPSVLTRATPAAQRAFWELMIRRAPTPEVLRDALGRARQISLAPGRRDTLWEVAANALALLQSPEDMDWLEKQIPKDSEEGVCAILIGNGLLFRDFSIRRIWDSLAPEMQASEKVQKALFKAQRHLARKIEKDKPAQVEEERQEEEESVVTEKQ